MASDETFKYLSFDIQQDRRTVLFNYELTHAGQTTTLTEKHIFPVALPDSDLLNRACRALHLALGISYYKIFVSQSIEHPYVMTGSEVTFWNDVFSNGLGEFLYINNLSKEHLAKFYEQTGTGYDQESPYSAENKALLGIGGGKDSIVAGEILKDIGVQLEGFVMATGEQLGQSEAVANVMDIPLNAIERTLDPQLLKLQEEPDAYKGHVPISLIFGLVGTVLAISNNAAFVVVANESSASIPRIVGQNGPVNHQWSKSFEFEKSLQQFIKENISDKITYFSAIRPLSSVAVAKKFAAYPKYFEVFTSDNFVFRIDPERRPNGRWSLESPKSLSSFILLAPWLSEEDLLRTFGQNFLNEPSLEKLFYESAGVEGQPPLDCVGTPEELVLSLNLAYKQGKFTDTLLVKYALERGIIDEKDWQSELDRLLAAGPEQAFPPELESALIERIKL